jgi:hypothetical protein
MAKTSAIEGIPGKICGGIRKREIQSTDIATTISRIALDMGAWQGKKNTRTHHMPVRKDLSYEPY